MSFASMEQPRVAKASVSIAAWSNVVEIILSLLAGMAWNMTRRVTVLNDDQVHEHTEFWFSGRVAEHSSKSVCA